jgi:class 3 adenylate cyclase/tetratricopeptide (TPR) repeat protein
MMNLRSQPYMPEEYAARLRTARAAHHQPGERRVITMLFCDVRGSTAMAQQLDPEEWAEIMNEAFEYLITPIYRYEGTVARLMGDGLLAFFGAPIAHEDDPQRAVLAGLDIVKGIRRFAAEIQRSYHLDFDVRVGINTGPVVVGEVGTDLAVEYTAMGDAINLAARMETTALPGTVQISAHTYRHVAPLFDVWDVGPIPVKGKEKPVHVYRVLGWKAEPGSVRGIEGLDAPLVGRKTEMNALRQVMHALHAGRGGIVCLVGDAGLGKSRLIRELSTTWRAPDTITGTPLSWLESRGISYESARPYGLFLQFMRQNFGVRENDPPDVVRAKIAQGTRVLGPNQRDRMARVAEALLGVGDTTNVARLEGEDFKRELFATLLDATRTVASRQPTVLVCDDVHWADPASIELLIHLFQLVEELPVLFLYAFRGYRHSPGWQVTAAAEGYYPHHYTEVRLQPLSEQESDSLVTSLLAVDELPGEVRRHILQKTEGNPLFVEEVVRTLIEEGAVSLEGGRARWNATARRQDIEIPDNIKSLLMARIDRLDEETRQTLQLAAVIGRTFHHRILQDLSGETVALDRQLDTLQRAGLIQEAARVPELQYTFRHALTRDAAYASILHRRRREFHRCVAEAIERLFPQRLEEQADRLAHHYAQARDDQHALKYYTLAGDRAARVYANLAAEAHYGRAIALARHLDDAQGQLIDLYTCRGRVLEVAGRYDDALDNYREMEALARKNGDRALELAALIPQATMRSTFTAKFNPARGRELAERALGLAHELGDPHAEARALWNLMLLAHYADDDQVQALAYGEQALTLAREHGLREELAYVLHDIANAYLDVGRSQEAWAACEEAGALWRELGNMPMLVDYLANSSWHLYQQGRLDRGLARVEEGLRISRSIKSPWGQAYSLMTLGPLHLAGSEYTQAIQAIQDAIPLAQQADFDVSQELTAALGGIYGFLGDLPRSVELLRRVRTQAHKREDQLVAGTMLALVYLHHGHPAQASAAYSDAQELFKAGTSNPTLSIYRMVAPVIEAELACVNGAYERAIALAAAGIEGTRRPTITADLRRIQGQVLLAQGHLAEAEAALRRARADAETPVVAPHCVEEPVCPQPGGGQTWEDR